MIDIVEMGIAKSPRTVGGARLVFDCQAVNKRGNPQLPVFQLSVPLIDAMRGVFPSQVVKGYLQCEKDFLKSEVWDLAQAFYAVQQPNTDGVTADNSVGTSVVYAPIAAAPEMK